MDVAVLAFDSPPTAIVLRKECSISEEDIIRRLKAEGEKERREYREEGRQAGKQWAELDATPKQLCRLREGVNEYDGIDSFIETWTDDPGTAVAFLRTIDPGTSYERDELEVGEREIDDDIRRINDDDFARGFIEAAIEIWDKVKDKI